MGTLRRHRPRVPGAVRRSLTALILGALALLAAVPAASAHDGLTGTNPRNGQTVEEVPDVVALTFSGVPMALGTEVLVKDADGKDWPAREFRIVDNVVSQPVNPDASDGQYMVVWRVVSSDGHPIEGTFGFTTSSGGAGGPSPQQTGPEPAVDRSEESGPSASDSFPIGSVLGTVGVLVLGLLITWAARRRQVRNRSD
jgi:copper resistance protein C